MHIFEEEHLSPFRVFLYGLIIAILALSPALLRYNGAYITRGDYIEQQLPFLAETRRILLNGLDTYSFNTFLGAPAIGSYAFYTLGSPFVWPVILFPKSALPYFISVAAVLKHAFCMLTAFLYLKKMVRKKKLAFLGAILYTFSSFTVVNTQFYHFTEVITCFPLLLLGFETAMHDTPRPGLLALCCGLNTLINYYFMFSSAILTALYFLFRIFSSEWKTPYRFRRFAAALFECIVGCALAGILLCPAMLYMLQITRTGTGINYFQLYTLPNILERIRVLLMPIESNVVHAFYGDAASWTSTAAWLPLVGFTYTACFLFESHTSDSAWLHRLLFSLFIFSFIPVLCGVFVLESNPMYTRWWYGLVLMMVLATLYVLDLKTALPEKHLIKWFFVCTFLTVLLTFPFLIPEEILKKYSAEYVSNFVRFLLNRMNGARSSPPFILLSLILTITSGALFLFSVWSNSAGSLQKLILATIFICITAYAGYIWTGDTYLKSGGEHPVDGLYSLDEIAKPTLSALKSGDPKEYCRIDYGLKLRNYGLLRGNSSLTAFHSLRQAVTGRFISLAGFGYDESTTVYPPSGDGSIRAFLSVNEYHLTDENDTVPEEFVYDREENGFPVYKNPNRVPIGFLQTVCTGTHDQPMTPDTVGKTLLAAVALDEPYLSKAKETLETLDVYHIPDWKESVTTLQNQACDLFETNMHGFHAHITAKQAGYLVFTIPYDKGFTASIDNMPTEIIPCDVSFMAISLSSGEHDIQFHYHNRGFYFGVLVTLVSAAILLIYVILSYKHYIVLCPESVSR